MKQAIKCFVAAIAAMLMGVSAYAQVTTSSLGGLVTDADGQVLPGVAVVATHEPSGTVYGVVTNTDGRYAIQGMRNGGPYKVEVSCLGYQTITFTEVFLQLGEPFKLNAKLAEDKEMLSEAVVISTANSKFSAEQTGASTNISNTQMLSIPTVSRSITDVAKLSPYAGGGMSFAGADGRSSNFTVDGANFNNNFGLTDKLPGGGSPISLDAIDEVQVVVSPYDVRQTNFIGGGINAITKSGTNQFKASAYVYHRNENMRGSINTGIQTMQAGQVAKERTTTYGATVGGPIVKNKLFFFVNFEYVQSPQIANRWQASKDGVADPTLFISRTKVEDLQAVKDHLMENYGYDTGSFTDFPANESNMKVLARIDWNITDDHHLAIRYNFAQNRSWKAPNRTSSDTGLRTSQDRMSEYSMSFANSMYSMDNNVNSLTLDLNSRFNNDLSNQFLFTFSKLDDIRGSNSKKFPFIDILDGTGVTPYISAGYELFTWNNGVHNTVITLKDDVTYYLGNHKITAGLNYEYQMADNSYMRNGTGYYRYSSLDDFLTQKAPESVCLTYGYDGEENPAARVRFHQAGLYAQDEWTPSEDFKLTYGLRLDGLFFDNQDLMTNKAILELDYGGRHIDTGKWPNVQLSVSPRVGFSWDILGDNSLKLRGGTGLFSGRLPLVFFTNMPTNSGMVQNLVRLQTKYNDGEVSSIDPFLKEFAGPMITDTQKMIDKLHALDPVKYPKKIYPENGVLPGKVGAVDPKFKMPQIWKTSIALDYAFPVSFPFSITGEFIYNKTVNGVAVKNWNQRPTGGFAHYNGADARPIYPAGQAGKYTGTDAFVLVNTPHGYGYVANLTMKMEPVKNLNLMASYTYTCQKEQTGMPGNDPESAFTHTPTVHGPNWAPLHNSQYMTPHRVIASISYMDKAYNRFSLFYEGHTGRSYTYMYDGDFNNDGYSFDAIYVPKDQSEIRFVDGDNAARYWDFAKNDKYLTQRAGMYAKGYSVYAPWTHRIDFRYSHDFRITSKKYKSVNTIQLNLDFKNVLNFFNSNWGVSKYMNPALKEGRILDMDHVDAGGVPVFKVNDAIRPGMKTWVNNPSPFECWYVQVGIKYMFN